MNVHVTNPGAVALPKMRKYADPKLEKSDGLVIDGAWYAYVRRDVDGISVRSMDAQCVERRLSRREFWELYYARRLTLHRGSLANVDPVVARLLARPLDSFPKQDVDEAMRRLFYLDVLDKMYAAGRVSLTKLGYGKAARTAAWLWRRQQAADAGVPARSLPLTIPDWTTVRDWRGRYISAGKQLVALVPAHSEKGLGGCKLDGRVQVIIDELVRIRFLTREEIPLVQVHEEICGRIMEMNDSLPPADQLQEPHYNTLSGWIRRNYTDFEIMLARKGKEAAIQKMKQVKKGPVGSWPMHTIQMDYVRLNMMAVTKKGDPLFGSVKASRPWLVLAICTLTDMIVGWYVTFEPPSWQSAMACLRHAVMPKDTSHVPGILSDYPCMGGFKILMLDNEKAFRSQSLKVAVASLKAAVKWGPAGQPRRRGKIERAIRTLNSDVTGFVPGKTFSNVQERGDYDSEGMAALEIEEIDARITRWVVDVYHNRPRGLFGLTPLQKWEKFGGTVSVLDNAADLDALLAISVQRTIQREGVRIFGLRYNSPALQKLLNRSGGRGREYAIKINPADLAHILVFNDMDEKWEYVGCVTPDYADGVDLETWRRELALARKMNGGNSPSRRHLLTARKALNEEAGRMGAKPRRYTDQRTIDYFREHIDDPVFELAEAVRPVRRRAKAVANPPDPRGEAGDVPVETDVQTQGLRSPFEETEVPADESHVDTDSHDPNDLDDWRNWR